MIIRYAEAKDEAAWRNLWLGYNHFYQANVPEHITVSTWGRILDPNFPVFARVAEKNGVVVGFCNFVLHPGTWNVEPICYLEDLYVAEGFRGLGIGRKLVEDLAALGQKEGWARLYWHTAEDNVEARRMYDKLVHATDFVLYRVFLR